jgi:membrane fusion protein (multidrug efflux system)
MYPNAILVPQTALQQGQQGMFVYVIEEGKAVMRPVTAGDLYQNNWIIEEGLSSGETVIVQGVNKVQNHTPVLIQNVAPGMQLQKKAS